MTNKTKGNPIYGDIILKETVEGLMPYKPQIEALGTRAVMIQFNKTEGGEPDTKIKAQHQAANISTAKKLETFKSIGFKAEEQRIPWEISVGDFSQKLKDLDADPTVSSILFNDPCLRRENIKKH